MLSRYLSEVLQAALSTTEVVVRIVLHTPRDVYITQVTQLIIGIIEVLQSPQFELAFIPVEDCNGNNNNNNNSV